MSERTENIGIERWAKDDRDEARHYRTLLDSVDVGIYQLDTDGRFTTVNDVLLEETGYSREELLGQHVSLLFESGDADRFETLTRDFLADGADVVTLEASVTTADGDTVPYELRNRPLERDGEFRGVAGIGRRDSHWTTAGHVHDDHDERERELEHYETIVETVTDGVYVLDETYHFTMVNDAYAEMTGYTREELIGAHCSLVVGEDVSMDAADRSATLATGGGDEHATIEAEIHRADGSRLPAESRFTPLVSEDGDFRGTVGVVRDVTDRQENQRKLEESNERLEQFAYAASHDLQEPLRMISSYLRLIEGRYGEELDEDGEEFIAFAVDGADRMREMIDGLLSYSRVDTQGNPFERVDLNLVFEEALEDLHVACEETDATVTVESLPHVWGDASQLRQVFENLLRNAITYSGDEPPRVQVTVDETDEEWVVSVHDEGIGVKCEDIQRIFEVFQRAHCREEYAGTGIGLALCQRIVERHDGRIWVDSTLGDGSTFSFTLPVVESTE